MKKNKIIITGGAGFVGTNLINLLLKKTKYKIISIDNYSSGLKKNHIKTKVVGCKTIREKNGMAYSSRNSLLSHDEKIIASKIYKLLIRNKKKLIRKYISLNQIKNKISKLGVKTIDYINILDINKLIRPYQKNNNYKIFIAYYLRSTRLIDNI